MLENLEKEIQLQEEKLERIKGQMKVYAQSILNDDNIHDIVNTVDSMNGYIKDIQEAEGQIKALERAIRIVKKSK